jgi:hypothetical protein
MVKSSIDLRTLVRRVSRLRQSPIVPAAHPSLVLILGHAGQVLLGSALLILGTALVLSLVLMPMGLLLVLVGLALMAAPSDF